MTVSGLLWSGERPSTANGGRSKLSVSVEQGTTYAIHAPKEDALRHRGAEAKASSHEAPQQAAHCCDMDPVAVVACMARPAKVAQGKVSGTLSLSAVIRIISIGPGLLLWIATLTCNSPYG